MEIWKNICGQHCTREKDENLNHENCIDVIGDLGSILAINQGEVNITVAYGDFQK